MGHAGGAKTPGHMSADGGSGQETGGADTRGGHEEKRRAGGDPVDAVGGTLEWAPLAACGRVFGTPLPE